MSKNLKISYILFFVFSAILLAWNTLMSFFCGVAINFVALVGLMFVIILLSTNEKSLFSRIKDLFFIACGFCALELIVYFAFEYGTTDFDTLKGFLIFQNVISFLGLLFFVYISFRFTTEIKNKRIKFIEIMLGNEKRAPKVKKAKEITNGSLEEKPNKQNHEEQPSNQEESLTNETEE